MLAAHGKLIHLVVWSRPDLEHAVSVLGRYVHNLGLKLWHAYHRIAKCLNRTKTKDFRFVVGVKEAVGAKEAAPTTRCAALSHTAQQTVTGLLTSAIASQPVRICFF